jgi:four helix bundle protein
MGGAARGFEDLHIYQEARELANRVFGLTRRGPITRDRGFVDQLRRSAVSILSNIAEGFERETNSEFIRALYIAKGSFGELRAQVTLAADQKYFTGEESQDLIQRSRRLSAGIYNLIQHLKRSPNRRPSSLA